MSKGLMSDIDLASLVVRAQTGDRTAYDGIVRRFQDMAVGYASSLLGDFHLAEDAAQEAFVGAWTELPRLREPEAFPGWLRRMVFMRCGRYLRRRRPVVAEVDAGQRNPLSYAAGNGHTQIVEKLLDLGADPNQAEGSAPRGGALFGACAGNRLEMAKLLLERGADPNAGLDSSGTCLTIVEARHGQEAGPLQDLLREHGAVMPPFAMDDDELDEISRVLPDTSANRTAAVLFEELFPVKASQLWAIW